MENRLQNIISEKDELQKKIDISNLKIRQSKYSISSKERKARTRLLIQKGALLDKYFDTENLGVDDVESLLKMFSDYVVSHKPDKYKKTDN